VGGKKQGHKTAEMKPNAKTLALAIHSQEKRSKSCHWGCTFSKGTVFYLKGAYWYLNVHIST